MKTLFTVILVGGIMSCLWTAQSSANNCPNLINYQGRLTDSTNAPISDGPHALEFRAYPTPSGGTLLWTESTSVSTVDGLFSYILGSVSALPVSLFPDNDQLYMEVKVDGVTLSPRTQIVAVGYSRRVYTVDQSAGGTITGNVLIQGKGTIGLGHVNTGVAAFVAGSFCTAGGDSSTVGGGGHNQANGNSSTVSGGYVNVAAATYSTVGGGSQNGATGTSSTVGGGTGNIVSIDFGTIGGGTQNAVGNTGATIGGGGDNFSSGLYATLGGGRNNKARGDFSVVSGGGGSFGSDSNAAAGSYSSIGGGRANRVTDEVGHVGGGSFNRAGDNAGTTNDAPGATVGGGQNNTASDDNATVCGGSSNQAVSASTFVGGGFGNAAAAFVATVCGGFQNSATGEGSMVPGGRFNLASGAYSFAAGYRARAENLGCFVWADSSSNTSVASTGSNQFIARAAGGSTFYSDAALANGVTLAAGGGSWASVSDRNVKEHFAPVDGQALLDRLATVPIRFWNYKAQSASIRHIGPTAQDFYEAFGVGEDDRHITAVDADGIAYAAIQALNEKTNRIDALEQEVAELRLEMQQMRDLLETRSGGPEEDATQPH